MAELKKEKVIIDTNLLLDDSKILFKLINSYEKIVIPITVLKELDKHKFKKATAFSARQAIRALVEFKEKYRERIEFDTKSVDVLNDDTNDAKIIRCTQRHNATLATKDMSMDIIAEAQGIDTQLYDVILNNIFNPYVYIEQHKLFDINDEDVFGYGRYFNGDEYIDVFNLFCKAGKRKLSKDTWFFVIINTPTNNPTVYAHNPIRHNLERIDDVPKYREIIINKDTSIKALDIYQTCAIYAMTEAPNTLLCGSYGSGKSLLSTAFALTVDNKKTFISRPNLTVDRRFELGFLPGSLEEKLSPWMAGVLSSLYFIFSNTKAQVINKTDRVITYDFVKDNIFRKYFEMLPIETIQGTSFMDNDLLLLDEAQLCSISVLATILSRFGKGSKLIATGDTKQIYGSIPPAESGLLKLLRLLPNKYMAYIELKYNYRSKLLDLADKLQNKTLF
ncbi:MAG: hypothetical protein DRJ45_06835 [Thermoprotei archaeon]|nr:MAG: hypothetical protein DRJ45_06835 [Thermoprotei archaeon]